MSAPSAVSPSTAPPAAGDRGPGGGGPGGGSPGGGGARRGWIVLVVLVVVAVVAVVFAGRTDDRAGLPLSTTSTAPDGSEAVARILESRGTTVRETDSLRAADSGTADRTVLVLDPLAYSDDQLRTLAAATSGPVVLLAPDDQQLTALGVAARLLTADDTGGTDTASPGDLAPVLPRCDNAAADAAGAVAFAPVSSRYRTTGRDVVSCYGGRLLAHDQVVVLGDQTVLTNDRLAATGAAALALNVLGRSSEVVWLRPGADGGGATGSLWDALPPHTELAAIWLLIVGLLLVLWRGRRLGAPVREPLPVAVRAAEVLYGRGRLYARHHDVAAGSNALRGATLARLRRRFGLPSASPAPEVAHVVAQRTGVEVPAGLLDGPPPPDDDALIDLAAALRELEQRVGAPGTDGRPGAPGAG